MTKIAFTGGGTVGHVSVNLSLIPTALEEGHEAFYIGSKNGMEREMIESQLPEIPYHKISSGKLRRYISFENIKDIAKYITPNPGGVGPMTVAMIIDNLLMMKESENNG